MMTNWTRIFRKLSEGDRPYPLIEKGRAHENLRYLTDERCAFEGLAP